ncbi:MAG: NFACT family protein [Candidatus Micrarchaeota archaeon]|nr:NFACT family protein [Candidatus Micrarchaeota archaeon]
MPGKIRALSSAELGAVAKELGTLVSSYFKNFYELKEGSFLMTFSKERKETAVYINLAKTINLTEFKEKTGEPTEFALSVRKKLDGNKVESVAQHESDRILVISFSGKEQRRMIIEMFDRGNLLLVNKDNIIELVYSGRSFKERSVRKSMLYSFPQQRGSAGSGAVSERLKEVESHMFATLSELLDSLYVDERSTSLNPEKSREAEELQKSAGKLRKQMEELKVKADEYREAANRIFANMHEINELISLAGKSKAKSAEQLGDTGRIRVKRLDAKKKTITVELD